MALTEGAKGSTIGGPAEEEKHAAHGGKARFDARGRGPAGRRQGCPGE